MYPEEKDRETEIYEASRQLESVREQIDENRMTSHKLAEIEDEYLDLKVESERLYTDLLEEYSGTELGPLVEEAFEESRMDFQNQTTAIDERKNFLRKESIRLSDDEESCMRRIRELREE